MCAALFSDAWIRICACLGQGSCFAFPNYVESIATFTLINL